MIQAAIGRKTSKSGTRCIAYGIARALVDNRHLLPCRGLRVCSRKSSPIGQQSLPIDKQGMYC